MRVGLTAGISSGKSRFEERFRSIGYPIFDVDKVDFALRTGEVQLDTSDEIFGYGQIVKLVQKLSPRIIGQLQYELPNLYDSNGRFVRTGLLQYINDDTSGGDNHQMYGKIMNPPFIEIYLQWLAIIGRPSVLSSGVLVERGNLSLIDSLYIIQISEEEQIRNLLEREQLRTNYISKSDALKAVRRSYPTEKLVRLARLALGEEKVHVIPHNADLETIVSIK